VEVVGDVRHVAEEAIESVAQRMVEIRRVVLMVGEMPLAERSARVVDLGPLEAVREHLDPRFVLTLMPPEQVKGIDEPVVTYAVRE